MQGSVCVSVDRARDFGNYNSYEILYSRVNYVILVADWIFQKIRYTLRMSNALIPLSEVAHLVSFQFRRQP